MEKEQAPLTLEQLTAEQMAAFVNGLVDRDFPRLVQLLYRLDVSEEKLRSVLLEHPTGDAGNMIAELILQRIAQRDKAKGLFKKQDDIPEDERW